MPARSRYQRVVLKVSGEGLCAPDGCGIDPAALGRLADELAAAARMRAQIGLVVGGGNLVRGRQLVAACGDVHRVTADQMGMLATVINALALQDALERRDASAAVLSAIPMPGVCQTFDRRRAIAHLTDGRLVIFAGGTGNPLFTTDTCAALRAGQIGAQALLKATQVDGVYDSDPRRNPKARRYARLTYQQVLRERLGVMDLTAVSMCMDSGIPIVVFRLAEPGSLARALAGRHGGTVIAES